MLTLDTIDLRKYARYRIDGIHLLDGFKSMVHGTLVVRDGKVIWCGPSEGAPKLDDSQSIDGQGWLVTPGLINGHTHVAMNFLRDIAHGEKNMIGDIFFPTESRLSEEDIALFSLSGLVAGLKSGVTHFCEHYYFSKQVGHAMEKLGLSGYLGETVADIGGAFPGGESWVRAKNLIENWPFSDAIQPVVAPHATDTVSKDLLKEIAHFANNLNLPIHMHMAQTQIEYNSIQKKHGCSPVQLADKLGLLNESSLLVHCIANDTKDFHMIRDRGASVGVCATSEIYYEKLLPIAEVLQLDIPLVIGTDCAASHDSMDMLRELFVNDLLAIHHGNPWPPQRLLSSVFCEGHRVLGGSSSMGAIIGAVEKDANLVFYNWGLDGEPVNELKSWFIRSCTSRYVKHVFCNGRFALYHGRVQQISEDDLRAERSAKSH